MLDASSEAGFGVDDLAYDRLAVRGYEPGDDGVDALDGDVAVGAGVGEAWCHLVEGAFGGDVREFVGHRLQVLAAGEQQDASMGTAVVMSDGVGLHEQ